MGLGLWFLYAIRPIVILLFLAFIIMVALNPGVSKVQRWTKLPRALSTAIVYLLVMVTFVGMVGLLLPPMVKDFYELVRTFNLPFVPSELPEVKFTLSEIGTLVERVGNSLGMVFAIVASTFTGAFTFITLLVMSFYLTLDRPFLHLKVQWFTRKKAHVQLVEDFLNQVEYQLGGWVRGQFILMLVIGAITYTGLTIIGVPYALPLAVLAGMLEILPNLGPTIAAVPAVILAFITAGWFGAGATTVFYIIVQQFENNLIVPKILKDNVDVNPLVAIVTILIGLKLGGMVGALLSIPAYIILRTVYGFWYRSRVSV
jgi:predicted PurR-regulated permease PerM